MTPAERQRLAAAEERLAQLDRELRATRARLNVLRQLLADEAPELACADRDSERILDAISGPSEATADRPVLQALEGARAVDADSVRATAAADQAPGWAAHSDRVAGRARRMPRRDRHGLHAL